MNKIYKCVDPATQKFVGCGRQHSIHISWSKNHRRSLKSTEPIGQLQNSSLVWRLACFRGAALRTKHKEAIEHSATIPDLEWITPEEREWLDATSSVGPSVG